MQPADDELVSPLECVLAVLLLVTLCCTLLQVGEAGDQGGRGGCLSPWRRITPHRMVATTSRLTLHLLVRRPIATITIQGACAHISSHIK